MVKISATKKQFSQKVHVIKNQTNIFGQEFKGPIHVLKSNFSFENYKKNSEFKNPGTKRISGIFFFLKLFEFFGIFLNKPVYANLQLPNGEFLEVQLSVLFLPQ